MRAVICCLLVAGLLIPSAVMCVQSVAPSNGGDTEVSEFALCVVGASDVQPDSGIGWVVGYVVGKALDWYIKFMREPGRLEPPDPPGSWWPGRV
jgi:hypothetical protein